MMELNDLLLNSERLVMEIGNDGNKRMRREAAELEQVTMLTLDRRDARMGGARQQNGALRLLAGARNFNAENLMRRVTTMELKTQLDPSESFQPTDIEGYLKHHEETIIHAAIKDAVQSADENTRRIQIEWVKNDWEKAGRDFLNSLPMSKHHTRTQQQPQQQQQLQQALSVARVSQPFHSTLQDLNDVLAYMNQANSTGRRKFRPASEFRSCLTTVNDLGMEDHNFFGFTNVLDLVVAMVQENSSYHFPSGWCSPLFFKDEQSVRLDKVNERITKLVLGCKHFFENQFYMVRVERILNDPQTKPLLSTNSKYLNTKAKRILQYTELMSRKQGFGFHYETDENLQIAVDFHVPIWPALFYSIHVGEFSTAIELVEDVKRECIDPQYHSIYADIKDLLTCTMNIFNDIAMDMDRVDRIRSSLEHVFDIPDADPYLLRVLNLLCLRDPYFQSDTSTIEDFLWTNLWFTFLKPTEFSMQKFAENIKQDGPDPFDDSGSSPFYYALVLITCQEYGEAIEYLWGASQPVAAVHLLVIFLYYGLLLPCQRLNRTSGYSWTVKDTILNWLTFDDPGLKCLDIGRLTQYILALDSNWCEHASDAVDDPRIFNFYKSESINHLEDALTTLITDDPRRRSEFRILVGDVDRSGRRERGVLDQHFPKERVDRLINKIAEVLKDRKDPDVLEFSALSGSYHNALYVACDQLSRVVCCLSPTRDKIIRRCQELSDKLGSPQIIQIIRDDNKEYLIQVLPNLLKFCDAFNCYQEPQGESQALQLINDVGYTPNAHNEVEVKFRAYQGIMTSGSDCLSNVIGDIMRIKMHCLQRLFRKCSNTNKGLKDSYKRQAETLCSFSRRMDPFLRQPNVTAEIEKIEKEMI